MPAAADEVSVKPVPSQTVVAPEAVMVGFGLATTVTTLGSLISLTHPFTVDCTVYEPLSVADIVLPVLKAMPSLNHCNTPAEVEEKFSLPPSQKVKD